MSYPKLVTIAIIEQDDKVLLIKRGNPPELGKWAFPGGTGAFETASNPSEAVQIEVKYDLNVEFTPTKFFNLYFRDNDSPTLSIVYLGTIKGEIKINPASVLECKSFEKNELENLELAFDQNKMAVDYLSRQ